MSIPERIARLGNDPDRFSLPGVPRYAEMVERACAAAGLDPSGMRVFRLRVAYPVTGFQYVMAFQAPPDPGGIAPAAGDGRP